MVTTETIFFGALGKPVRGNVCFLLAHAYSERAWSSGGAPQDRF
jgi:hypothetical protein